MPKDIYISAMSIDDLLKAGDFYLVRRTERNANETFNELDQLREDAILTPAVPNMSLNILGGNFLSEHIVFAPKGNGMKEWKQGPVYFMDFKDCYETLPIVTPIFFSIGHLHRKSFPYYRGKDAQTKKIIADLKLTPESNGAYKFHGYSLITHTPTNLNYWHIELILQDMQGVKIRNASAAWIASAAKEAFGHFITGSARRTKPSVIPIDSKFYLQSN